MPRLVKQNNFKQIGKEYKSTLLIEHFGMEAIFIKLPNFEPLME